MRAGELNHIIHCDEPVAARSDAGEETVTFVERFAVRGKIADLVRKFGLEGQYGVGGILAGADVRITLRWSPETATITPKWRMRYGTTIFNVLSVSPVAYDLRQIDLICGTGINQG